jgi:hypothetical protein
MKQNVLLTLSGTVTLLAVASLLTSRGADNVPTVVTFEYATIRWGGRDNTHVIRPGGEVEFVGNQLRNIKRPDRSDDRSLYMNVVMNGMAQHGWEFSGMTTDDIVMRRPAKR